MGVLLEVHEISKRFGGIIAVEDFSFYVKEKEILGLIGPNGAGKTTVFNLIMGEVRQDKGRVFFNGKDITDYPTHKRVNLGIARSYQIPRAFKEMTLYDNLRMSMLPDSIRSNLTMRGYDPLSIKKVAIETGIEEFLLKYPEEVPLAVLRRTEFAMALLKNPRLILLDEIFSGLTTTEINSLIKLIKQKRDEGMTFIVIDHNLRAISTLVDRVVVMNFGRKIAEGLYQEIINNENVKKAYLGG